MDRRSRGRVVVVGASLAGLRAAETLRREGFDGALTLVGAEPHRPYDRPPLSKEFLSAPAGSADGSQPPAAEPAALTLRGVDELDAEWRLGSPAVRLDLDRRIVVTADGDDVPFDGLVVATGSRPRRLPGLDPARPGIDELRTVDDALAIRTALAGKPRLVIVGCGFIGVELASTARTLDIEVTIVSVDPALCIAGPLVSRVCTEQLADHGVEVRLGRRVDHVVGDDRVEAVVLDDGTRLEADHVVVAAGAAPDLGWLEGSGVPLDRGVVCDATCAVAGVEGVVAAGDVARWPNPLFPGAPMRVEHWTNAVEQGAAAARTLLHGSGESTVYAALPSFWSDHFGVRLQSVGMPGAGDRVEIVEGSIADRRFAAACYRGDEMVGGIAYGMPREIVRLRARLAGERRDRAAGGVSAV